MTGLDQEGHDRTDDENRLESFAQNDQKRLEKRFPVRGRRLREIDDRGQSIGNRIARALGAGDVVPLHRSLEVGEVALHRRDQSGLLRARRRLQRLERDVRIECTVARFGSLTLPREVECAVEQRENDRRRAVASNRSRISRRWQNQLLAAERVDVADDVPALRGVRDAPIRASRSRDYTPEMTL